MPDLTTTYMGLPLKNPIIAGASGLTANLDSIKRLEDAGVAALVTKSLLEEEIQLEHFKFDEDQERDSYRHAEMIHVRPHSEFGGPAEHLMWVRKTKEEVGIPVIASLNAVNHDTWIEYARLLEETGVDALECNLFASPRDPGKPGAMVEVEQIELIKELKKTVSIPVSLKLNYFYTNPLHVITQLTQAGADALVLFNRLFEPDLDIERKKHIFPVNFSHEEDYRLPLRYAGLLEGQVPADICCSTGIFTGATVIKVLLAGATAVQTVSALYRDGESCVQTMLRDIEVWMEKKGHGRLTDFRGAMSKRHSSDPSAYTRAHYARLLMNPDEIVNNWPRA